LFSPDTVQHRDKSGAYGFKTELTNFTKLNLVSSLV